MRLHLLAVLCLSIPISPPVSAFQAFGGSLSYETFGTKETDIPGMAFGPNASGMDVLWVGSYSLGGTQWAAGTIVEIDPTTGAAIQVHGPGPWTGTGPAGLAYDDSGFTPFLWVLDYNGMTVYKVPVSNPSSPVFSFSVAAFGRPIGGLAFDGASIWASTETGLQKFNQSGGFVGTFAPPLTTPYGGLDVANGLLYAVFLDGSIEVRDLNYNRLARFAFCPSSTSDPSYHGDLAVDPNTGVGYWARRGLGDLYRVDLSTPMPMFCFGDGSSLSCPCANDSSPGSNQGCKNSTSTGAALLGCGSRSASSDNLILTATNCPPGQNAIFFMGGGQVQSLFGDGLRCVGSGGMGVFRFAIQNTGYGTMMLGPGIVAYTWTQFAPSGRITAGSTWNFQAWYRDPSGPCGSAFNLSNAIGVTFAP